MKNITEPKLSKTQAGWAARGDGWAVHAPTKEQVLVKFREREKFYEELTKRPMWYLNPENPDYNKSHE